MYTPNALLRARHALAAATIAATVATTFNAGIPIAAAAAGQPAHRQIVSTAVALVNSESTAETNTTIGVADSNLYNLSHDDLVARLNEMKTLGVTSLRIAVPWVYIQPTATTYDWSKMDNVVDTAASMGFSITGAVSGTPTWGGVPLAGAPNPTSYADFASKVASRYGSKIGAYEVWNEPNGVMFFAPVDAAKYTEVLKAAYTAIKAANPDAVVLAGALGATSNVKGISQAAVDFLKGMYAAGAAGYFDALSYHPYGSTLPFSAGAGVDNSALQQIQALYAVMVANGDGDLKIWGTEYGNATVPVFGITKAEQAQYLQDFIAAWTKLPFTGPAFVYTAQDLATGMLNAEANYGLFNSDGTPKEAALVLAKLLAELDANGVLPHYSAPTMSVARDVFLQVASVGFGLANTALIIPNAIIAAAYERMPEPAKKAFTAVATYVSARFTDMIAAVAPFVQAGIGALLNVGPALQNPQAALNAAVHQINRDLTNAGKSLNAALDGTRITIAHLTQPSATNALTSADRPTPAAGQPSSAPAAATPEGAASTAAAQAPATAAHTEGPASETTENAAAHTNPAEATDADASKADHTTAESTKAPAATTSQTTTAGETPATSAGAEQDSPNAKPARSGGRHRKDADNPATGPSSVSGATGGEKGSSTTDSRHDGSTAKPTDTGDDHPKSTSTSNSDADKSAGGRHARPAQVTKKPTVTGGHTTTASADGAGNSTKHDSTGGAHRAATASGGQQ